ncbi:MAG: S41 family peptidase [Chloroflexota bacterium]
MPTHTRVVLAFLLSILVITGSFTAGFVAAGNSLAVAKPTSGPAEIPTPGSTLTFEDRFALLDEAVKLVEKEYYDGDVLDSEEPVYGAIRGMLDSLGDPYTNFATPRQAEMQQEDLSGRFEGIGAEVEMKDGKLIIVSPMRDSPAEQAGLQPGDNVSHVDGKPTEGLAVTDAVAMIRGPRGSTVALTIVREGTPEPFEVTVARDEIKVTHVLWEMLPDAIAYLRITSFGDISKDVETALREIRDQKANALILDLRNNPGGYLEVAVDVTSQFLDSGVVVYQQERMGDRQAHQVKPGGLFKDKPMVVLVNGGSASASEIVAGALQDYGRAKLLGEKTFGKGSVQKIHTLSDDSSLRITVAHWLTPNGREIHNEGLEPDIVIAGPDTAPSDQSEDVQLQQAIEELKPNRVWSAPVQPTPVAVTALS